MAKTTTYSSHFEQREKGTSTDKTKIPLGSNEQGPQAKHQSGSADTKAA